MAGLFGIGGSANKTDRKTQLGAWGALTNAFNSLFPQAQSGLTAATDWFKGILSGDRNQISQMLGPQITTIQNQANQRTKSTNEFAGRSGGTASSNIAAEGDVDKEVQAMIDSLIPSAATNLGALSLGESGQAIGAEEAVGSQSSNDRQMAAEIQQQQQGAILSALLSLGSAGVNEATSGAGIGGFGEG